MRRDNLLHLIGLLPRFLEQVRLAKLDEHPLSAETHQARDGVDQKSRARHGRCRNFRELGLARRQTLKDLLHRELFGPRPQ